MVLCDTATLETLLNFQMGFACDLLPWACHLQRTRATHRPYASCSAQVQMQCGSGSDSMSCHVFFRIAQENAGAMAGGLWPRLLWLHFGEVIITDYKLEAATHPSAAQGRHRPFKTPPVMWNGQPFGPASDGCPPSSPDRETA